MKRVVFFCAAMASAMFSLSDGGAARAENAGAPSPPAGWEAPPPLAKAPSEKAPKNKKPESPACCKFDSTCCSRQTTVDTFVPPRPARVFDVRLADLPEAVIKEAAKDGPPIAGAPSPKVTDDGGRPFPWPGGPQGYLVHIVPPGRYGSIKTSDWWANYFEEPEYRGMGAGEVRTITKESAKDRGVGLLYIPVEFQSFAKGEGDKIAFDDVKGRLEGSPEVKATYWMHVEAANVAAGIVHGYRGPYEGEPRASFLLPEVILGFESKDAKTVGGFFPSRFSNTVSFTMYHLPLGPGRSGLVNGKIDERQIHRWFPRPKGAEALPSAFQIVLATSQTSVEAEPRVRVMFVLR